LVVLVPYHHHVAIDSPVGAPAVCVCVCVGRDVGVGGQMCRCECMGVWMCRCEWVGGCEDVSGVVEV